MQQLPSAPESIRGCTNPKATNYNPNATVDDGSCQLPNATEPPPPDNSTKPPERHVNPIDRSGFGKTFQRRNFKQRTPGSGMGTQQMGTQQLSTAAVPGNSARRRII